MKGAARRSTPILRSREPVTALTPARILSRNAASVATVPPGYSLANEELPMTDTASHLVPERGKFRRALAALWAFLQAMESTRFDYTLDRIERLEREVDRLKEELRLSRATKPVDAHIGSADGGQTLTAPVSRFVSRAKAGLSLNS